MEATSGEFNSQTVAPKHTSVVCVEHMLNNVPKSKPWSPKSCMFCREDSSSVVMSVELSRVTDSHMVLESHNFHFPHNLVPVVVKL